MDAIIAATALVHDLEIWTQDSDFDALPDIAPDLRVLRGCALRRSQVGVVHRASGRVH
jgi:predicted nuclease of predicted toxin-antitoxin system